MTNNYKIQKNEAISLILIVMINKLILNVPFFIIDFVGTGTIVNLIYIGILGLIFVLILNLLFKNFPNADILDISEFVGGKFLKTIISIIFVCSFFLVSYITLTDFANTIKIVYFQESPLIFILLFFMAAILIANLVGLKSIIRTISLVIPFTIISIIITLFGVQDHFSIDKFVPIFGYNYKTTFLNGLLNIFSLYVITYYYFIMPLLNNPTDYKKITIISYIISWIILFSTSICILTLFPITKNVEALNAIYLLARRIELGDFLQRLDALFVLLWLISILCYLSLSIFMINRIIQKNTQLQDSKMLSYSTVSILFGLCLIPFNIATSQFIENVIYRYLIIALTFIVCFLIMIIANIKSKRGVKLNAKKDYSIHINSDNYSI